MVLEAGDTDSSEKIVAAKKICNGMQSPDRKVRKQAFIDLQAYLTKDEFSAQELRNIFTEINIFFLNGPRDKAEAVREQSIKFLTFLIVDRLLLNDFYLTYVFPVLVERIGTVELIEESEEIRLQLLQFLEAIIKKYANTDQLKPFLNDSITVLAETVKDKYPAIKELSCKTMIELAHALPRDFHLQAENLIKPVIACLTHQRYKVRVGAIYAIGEIILHSSYKGLDEVVGPLAEKLFDQIPTVRQAVGQVSARWLMEYRDRYSFFQKILPLLLTGLNDEVAETRNEAHLLWEKVGQQFQEENEKDLKDKMDFLTKIPKYYPKDLKRPNLGCRTLVERNISKIAPAIARELSSWQEDVRVRCSQLLCAIALHAEEGLTFNLQAVLPAMYGAARDSDKRVVDNIVRASELIGLFVRFDTWSKIVIPAIEDGPHFGHIMVLTGLVKASPKEYITEHIEDISKLLAEDYICYSRKKKYQLEMLNCVRTLMDKIDTSKDNSTGYNLYKIITALISLRDIELNEKIDCELYGELAIATNLTDSNQVLLRYTGDLLKEINRDPKSWTTVTDKACIFLTILTESNEAFGINLDIIGDILKNVLDSEVEAELRLKVFYILAMVFEKKDIIFKQSINLTDFLELLIKDIFVPSLVWHAGVTAESIRTMASTCLQYALAPTPDVDIFSSADVLRPLVDELIPLLLSLVEDASYRSRQTAIECLNLLKQHCSKKEVWQNDDLLKIYPEVLKRLDDPTEKVRLTALKVLPSLFENCPDNFKTATFSSHHEFIIDTLLIHLDDDEEDIQNMALDVLKVIANINEEELMSKIEKHKPLLRNLKGCDEIVDFIQGRG